jgi:protein-S-isoprenylcysteine O-methyltransferase Ste14
MTALANSAHRKADPAPPLPQPRTAVPGHVGFAGVAGFSIALWLSAQTYLSVEVRSAIIAMLAAAPMVFLEWRRARREPRAALADRPSAEGVPSPHRLGIADSFSLPRHEVALFRLLGSCATVAPFIAFHLAVVTLRPDHRPAMWVAIVYAGASVLLGTLAALLAPGTVRSDSPDLLLGRWVLGKGTVRGNERVGDHYRQWALKLFFIPFLAAALPGNTAAFDHAVRGILDNPSWTAFVFFCHQYFYLLDVTVGLIGYVLTLRATGSQIRSANPYREAWLFCLICYPPFWDPLRIHLLSYETGGITWNDYLEYSPLIYVWGVALIVLEGVYVWATIAFGIRFSNLTNRGILTSGPYRFLKHPAYVAKNASWWLWYLPFIPVRGFEVAAIDCLQLAAVNWLYFMRARTEEQHLREDPAYREYEAWIASRSWFGRPAPRQR